MSPAALALFLVLTAITAWSLRRPRAAAAPAGPAPAAPPPPPVPPLPPPEPVEPSPPPWRGATAGRSRGGFGQVPHRLLSTPLVRRVNGVPVETTLQAAHLRLYLVIQGWERTLTDGRRAPCAASWRQLREHWPGGEAPEVRTLQRHLTELRAAGWVEVVPCLRRGATVRGLQTVRAADYVARDVTPPLPSKITPPVTPFVTPPTSGSPPPDVRITPSLYSEEVESSTPYLHPDRARDPRDAEHGPPPGAGAGGPLAAAPQEAAPAAPAAEHGRAAEPAEPPQRGDVRRRTCPPRTTPIPRELIGRPLSRWFLDTTEYGDGEKVDAVCDVDRSYRGDWTRIRCPTATVEAALLARRRGEPWGRRVTAAAPPAEPPPRPKPAELAPAEVAEEALRALRALRERGGGQADAG